MDSEVEHNGAGTCHPLEDFYIPDYILVPESEQGSVSSEPAWPVIVFINSKSGGQLGGDLIKTYRELLNKLQVFDLGEEAPDKVLHKLYGNFERLKSLGDIGATNIQKNLRLIVAGGDGTASWLLGVVSDLKLAQPPPIATVPLGTGNNLPFSFGWGKKNPGTDRESVKSFLDQVKKARDMKIDSWHIIMRMRAPKEGTCDPIAPLELPHSLHAFQRVSSADSLNVEGYHTFRGGFWNYFSMGMDAQVSYAFHSERKLHPEKFKNQLINQAACCRFIHRRNELSYKKEATRPPERGSKKAEKTKLDQKKRRKKEGLRSGVAAMLRAEIGPRLPQQPDIVDEALGGPLLVFESPLIPF